MSWLRHRCRRITRWSMSHRRRSWQAAVADDSPLPLCTPALPSACCRLLQPGNPAKRAATKKPSTVGKRAGQSGC